MKLWRQVGVGHSNINGLRRRLILTPLLLRNSHLGVCSLPTGLIEGASYNVGMGHRFLKHVERTRLLLFVVDVSGFQLNLNSTFRNAFETVTLLTRELELYNSDLVCLLFLTVGILLRDHQLISHK